MKVLIIPSNLEANYGSFHFIRYSFGFRYWLARFVFVLIFFVLVLAITGQQIRASSLSPGDVPTADDIAARYLPGWEPVLIATITLGSLLLIYEYLQLLYLSDYLRYGCIDIIVMRTGSFACCVMHSIDIGLQSLLDRFTTFLACWLFYFLSVVVP